MAALVKTVKVSDKGQIAIPSEMRQRAGIGKGDELLVLQEGDQILIQKAERAAQRARRELRALLKHSELVAAKLWSSPSDDVWDAL